MIFYNQSEGVSRNGLTVPCACLSGGRPAKKCGSGDGHGGGGDGHGGSGDGHGGSGDGRGDEHC